MHNPQSNTNPEPWFDQAVRHGVVGLYALSLDGMPAADMLEHVVELWVDDLWSARAWQGDDAHRIRQAFAQLRRQSRRWPQMADFLAAVPKRDQQQLPAKVWTDESLAANRLRLAELVETLTERVTVQ